MLMVLVFVLCGLIPDLYADTIRVGKSGPAPFNVRRLGCLMPLSGAYGSYGQNARKGFDLAYRIFAADGNNSGLQIIYKDTASDPVKTKQAVRELADMGVSAIIGPVGPAEDAAKEAQLRGIPIITLTGKEGITDVGNCVFRHFLTQTMQVKAVTGYAFNILELKRFAVLYPDEPYGRDMKKLFENEVKRRGGVLVAAESYSPKSSDFGAQIKKISGAADSASSVVKRRLGDGGADAMIGFDAVFIPDSGEKVGLILPQLAFYDVGDVYLLGTNLWHSDKLVSMAGKRLDLAVVPEGFFPQSAEPHVIRFVERFKAAYGSDPGYIEAVAYDTAMMIFRVILQKPASHRDVRMFISNLRDVRCVTGLTSFDETGEAMKSLYLLMGGPEGFREIPR